MPRNIKVGDKVEIKTGWNKGDWGEVVLINDEDNEYHVAMFGDKKDCPVFSKRELKLMSNNVTESKIIEEKMEVHETLNPKLWDTNMNLLPDVREKILEIVEEFKETIKGMTEIDINPIDIYLLGSNASYNYTSHSDLDVHIVVNFLMIDDNVGLVQTLMNFSKADFNESYDVSIHGIDVELYVEDVTASTMSNGIYSVMTEQWIKKPEPIEVPELDIEADIDEWKDKVNKALDSKDPKQINDMIDSLYMLRKNGLLSEGEYGKGNQIFKEIRNLGLLDDLKTEYAKLKSKELSLENRQRKNEWSRTYIDKDVDCPECGAKNAIHISSIGDYTEVFCNDCDKDFEAQLIHHPDYSELKLIPLNKTTLENRKGSRTMKRLSESFNTVDWRTLDDVEEGMINNMDDKDIDFWVRADDNICKMLKSKRDEVLVCDKDSIEEIIEDNLTNWEVVKTLAKYSLILVSDSYGNLVVIDDNGSAYFADEDSLAKTLDDNTLDIETEALNLKTTDEVSIIKRGDWELIKDSTFGDTDEYLILKNDEVVMSIRANSDDEATKRFWKYIQRGW